MRSVLSISLPLQASSRTSTSTKSGGQVLAHTLPSKFLHKSLQKNAIRLSSRGSIPFAKTAMLHRGRLSLGEQLQPSPLHRGMGSTALTLGVTLILAMLSSQVKLRRVLIKAMASLSHPNLSVRQNHQ